MVLVLCVNYCTIEHSTICDSRTHLNYTVNAIGLTSFHIFSSIALLLLVTTGYAAVTPPDWLVTRITTPSTLTKTAQGNFLLSNGLISREFSHSPGFTTVDYFSNEKQSSLLRALSPEAGVHIDGVFYNVGNVSSDAPRAYMNRTAWALKPDPNAFQFCNLSTESPKAPFPYRPK